MVIDCANGAASQIAPSLFARLGARVVAINNTPDGRNINRGCGSLHLEGLRARVVAEGAHLGVAFDGDADRALFVDARGRDADGDATLWVMAERMAARGELAGETVVATVMSNIGLELALRTRGLKLLRANVGDKYVLEELLHTGATLGGEQSGHIIFRDGDATTGDGLLTALRVLQIVVASGKRLQDLISDLVVFPQVIKNVRVREKQPLEQIPPVKRAIEEAERDLDGDGRVVVRYSGTEPLARVMVEAASEDKMRRHAEAIASAIQKALGA
jgi:phosphoglucosamine mutase